MPTQHKHVQAFLEKFILSQSDIVEKNLTPNNIAQFRLPTGNDVASFDARWAGINISEESKNILKGKNCHTDLSIYQKNIENFLGTVQLPIGLAGPLRINGLFAQGDYLIPLATTEAALVASYNRGTKIISEAGGCRAALLNAYVTRCPCFAFETIVEVGQFLAWLTENMDSIKEIAEATTRFGKLLDVKYTIEGNRLFMSFEYYTGDASGQNMVTIATQAAFNYIRENAPIRPKYAYVEANMSGDKKSSILAFQNVRGRKVVAEVVIPKASLEQSLHITVKQLVRFCSISSIGGALSGTVGVQGHYANALAALYIACGQDAACVSESSMGITRFEETENGDLYASVTLPNIMVGTVGGGTKLPSQKACLEILGLYGESYANALAEVAASLCLAGELSISAALASDTFTQAHHKLARVGVASR